MEKRQFIAWEIIARRLRGELSEEEEREFQAWLEEDTVHRAYFERAAHMWEEQQEAPQTDVERLIARFDDFAARTRQRRSVTRRMAYAGYAAAVAVLVAVAAVFWLRQEESGKREPDVLAQEMPIVPGGARARIILADGSELNLAGSANPTELHKEGGVFICQEEGTIAYMADGEVEEEVYNTIVIPRGGMYCLKLADGTTVWLNADTRLRYPVAFVGERRVVELEGEAYFEVTKDPAKPFIVRTSRSETQVYGTAFNVSAYPGDAVQHTTLAEGSVGIRRDGQEYRLRPGQQACLGVATGQVEIREVNASVFCSWYQGVLIFENERLEDIMKRLARWYDVEVRFGTDNLRSLHFTGDLERYTNFTEILNLIGMTTNVRFEVKGRTVTVVPAEK